MEKNEIEKKSVHYNELTPKHGSGMAMLLLNLLMLLASVAAVVFGIIGIEAGRMAALNIVFIAGGGVYFCIIGPILFAGLKTLKPNESLVLTLFGKYIGTLKGSGFFFVNPFCVAVNPVSESLAIAAVTYVAETAQAPAKQAQASSMTKKISLKAMTTNNSIQKINDQLGNPVIIGVVVIWRVVNSAMAVFNVDNYKEFLSIQCDAALRNIVRLYPYDVSGDDNEKTLRGSSQEIADKLRAELQEKTEIAGLEILEARITHLSYAPEIAAAMLQRQQASAIIDARQMIVEGAVSMVEMALDKLSEREIVNLDEERKAAMVSNLLVILCGNKDAQPIVNSGSIY